ncbi:MAG: choice-of-anchor M domain-containing protein, partial [Propionibacteriaceae bacterium]|nr:choice-of-anchor M domain-containing protein [Propionibacteriaceae bacterium]
GLAGSWLSVWLPGQSPAWRGWVQADQSGAFSVGLTDARVRSQQVVVKDAEGGFVGWDRLEIVAVPDPGGNGAGSGGGSSGGGNSGGDSGSDDEPKAPSTQTCRPGITLDRGHIDAFYVSAANGKAVLQLMEDVTGYHVIREAETVLLRVKESALGTIRGAPKGTSSKGYVLPLTQRSDLIWPGWDTNRTSSSGYSDVAIKVTRVQGPGTVSLYTQGDWGAWKPILTSKSYQLPGTIREPRPAHTHAQWVFSKKGVYTLTAHAVATDPDTGRSLKTASHTYVFQVGDVPLGDVFCGLKTRGASDAKQVNAAVNKAAAEALEEARAAEQADAEAAGQEVPGTTGPSSGPRTTQAPSSAEADGGPVSGGSSGGGGNQALIAGLVGLGSGLLIAGIAGGTVWYVRRLRQVGSVVDAAA